MCHVCRICRICRICMEVGKWRGCRVQWRAGRVVRVVRVVRVMGIMQWRVGRVNGRKHDRDRRSTRHCHWRGRVPYVGNCCRHCCALGFFPALALHTALVDDGAFCCKTVGAFTDGLLKLNSSANDKTHSRTLLRVTYFTTVPWQGERKSPRVGVGAMEAARVLLPSPLRLRATSSQRRSRRRVLQEIQQAIQTPT